MAAKAKPARRQGPNRQVALVQRGRPYETPNVLTEALGDRIAKYVKMGDRPYVAAEISGVSQRIHYEWMEHGRVDRLDSLDTIYARYVQKIEAAEAFAEHQAQIAIRAHFGERTLAAPAEGQIRIPADWRAALAWLSRRRDGWQERKELTGKDGAPLFTSTGFEELNEEEAEARLHELRKRNRAARSPARTPARRGTRSKASAAKPA